MQYRLIANIFSTDEDDWDEIGGAVTTDKLDSSIQALIANISKNASFAGIAIPTTNPGTPDGHVFYIANGKGTYTNFGGIDVTEDEVIVLYYDKEWHKKATGIASNKKLTELELKTDKNSIVPVEPNKVLQGSIRKDGSFNLNDSVGWEYVLFFVAPNDKITFKASGYNSNVISFYALGQTPSSDTYIEGIASDGNGSSSYKEYNAIAKDFLIAAVCWYRPYGTPFISIERTSLIENFDSIMRDYEEKFSNTEETIGKIVGNGGLYSIANSYINLYGNVDNSENYNATDYILIDKSQDIIISNALTTASTCLISFYDKNKKFISDSAINNVESIHIEASQIPEDAVYFRSCTKKETLNSVRIYNNIGNSFQKFYEQNISRINDLIINDRVFSTNEDVNVYIKEVYAPLYKKKK